MKNLSISIKNANQIEIETLVQSEEIKKDEVLLEIKLSQLNPIDFIILNQHLKFRKYPYINGFDGFGKILKSENKNLIGKNALFTSLTNGTSQKFAIFKRNEVFILNDKINLKNVKQLLSMNPLTAFGMIEKVIEKKREAIIITGASTKIAKLLTIISLQKKITPILIGRNYNSKIYYEKQGVKIFLNSKEKDFEKKLENVLKNFKGITLLDCVTGNLQLQICKFLDPENSNIIYYGALDHNPPCKKLEMKIKEKNFEKELFVIFTNHLERDVEKNEEFLNDFFKEDLDLEIKFNYFNLEEMPKVMLSSEIIPRNILFNH